MKFLLDESTDRRLQAYLADLGHDVTAVAADYPAGLSDARVLQLARRQKRVLITEDLDFGELVISRGVPHAGVILLRMRAQRLAPKQQALTRLLSTYAARLRQFIVFTNHRTRLRRTTCRPS